MANFVRSIEFRWALYAAALYFEVYSIIQYVKYSPAGIPPSQHIALAFVFMSLSLHGAELKRNRNAKWQGHHISKGIHKNEQSK